MGVWVVVVVTVGVVDGTGSGDRKDIQQPQSLQSAAAAAAPGGAGGGGNKNKAAVRLAEEDDCKDDIRRTCKDARNNFAILECLQNERVRGKLTTHR